MLRNYGLPNVTKYSSHLDSGSFRRLDASLILQINECSLAINPLLSEKCYETLPIHKHQYMLFNQMFIHITHVTA
jgi:hypothetical protein